MMGPALLQQIQKQNSWTTSRLEQSASLASLILVGFGVAFFNPVSLLGYGYFFALTLITYRLITGTTRFEIIWLYAGLSAAALLLYGVQLYTQPDFIGFSGARGVGTDDCRFWVQIAESNTASLDLNCQWLRLHQLHPYSAFVKSIYPFAIKHPLDVLFVNVWGLCFLPIAARYVAFHLTQSPQAARAAFWLSLTCPFTLSNGLILIRDGWVAVGFICAVMFALQRRFVWVAVSVAVVLWLRTASGVLVAATVGALLTFGEDAAGKSRFATGFLKVAVLGALALYAVVAFMPESVLSQLTSGMFREDFLLTFIGDNSPDSTLYAIMTQPFYVRIPLGFMFFFVSPVLSLDSVFVSGILVPRNLMSGVIFPLSFLFTIILFSKGFVSSFRDYNINRIILYVSYFVLLLLISQLSIQIRHKTMLMPLYYVLVACGLTGANSLGKWLGVSLAVALVLLELVFLFR